MTKLIINFRHGEYSKNKDVFKAIFSGKYKWDGKQGWYAKDGFVKASQKMESGMPVTFLVDTIFPHLFKVFCEVNNIDFKEVNSFDSVSITEVTIEKNEGIIVNINRSKQFYETMSNNMLFTAGFVNNWLKLLNKDDERLNKMLINPELEIPIDIIFEKEEEDLLA